MSRAHLVPAKDVEEREGGESIEQQEDGKAREKHLSIATSAGGIGQSRSIIPAAAAPFQVPQALTGVTIRYKSQPL
jgi:hypothetical protein